MAKLLPVIDLMENEAEFGGMLDDEVSLDDLPEITSAYPYCPVSTVAREDYRYHNAASCPDCGQGMIRLGGCFHCPACGFSSCEM